MSVRVVARASALAVAAVAVVAVAQGGRPAHPGWRTGYSLPPVDVRAEAVLAARMAAGWSGDEVDDYEVGMILVGACTAMYDGANEGIRDGAAQGYLIRHDVPAKIRQGVPAALTAGVAVECPDARVITALVDR